MNECICDKFSNPVRTLDDAHTRLRHSREIGAMLDRRWIDSVKWMAVAQCPVCGQLWAEEAAPFGMNHGGGPDCYYQIETDDPAEWLRNAKPRISALQQG